MERLRLIVSEIVDQFVRGDYDSLIQRLAASRLTSEDLVRVIAEYRRKLVPPPSHAYDELDAVRVTAAAVPTWSVRAPLWTEEEGRSDLTLELTIALGPGKPSVELDDLHVL